jgi:hypothetical protein
LRRRSPRMGKFNPGDKVTYAGQRYIVVADLFEKVAITSATPTLETPVIAVPVGQVEPRE